jgi:hypothetical protein
MNLSEEEKNALKENTALFNLLKAAKHSLGSYIFGNSDPSLAQAVVDEIDKAFQQSNAAV